MSASPPILSFLFAIKMRVVASPPSGFFDGPVGCSQPGVLAALRPALVCGGGGVGPGEGGRQRGP